MARYDLIAVESDSKTTKGTKQGWLTGILYLAPSTEADGEHNLCPMATDECRRACLYGAGMAGVFPGIKAARVQKTLDYIADPKGFVTRLRTDIVRLIAEAKSRGLRPAVRLNGTSDIPQLARGLAREFPEVQFYDYTKIPAPWKREMANYNLTFSFSGKNLAAAMAALEHGVNVAVVFAAQMPAAWQGYRVVNGDESDLRFLDPQGVIVGLKAKGEAKVMVKAGQVGGFIQIA
jgi:hypothetical protein